MTGVLALVPDAVQRGAQLREREEKSKRAVATSLDSAHGFKTRCRQLEEEVHHLREEASKRIEARASEGERHRRIEGENEQLIAANKALREKLSDARAAVYQTEQAMDEDRQRYQAMENKRQEDMNLAQATQEGAEGRLEQARRRIGSLDETMAKMKAKAEEMKKVMDQRSQENMKRCDD